MGKTYKGQAARMWKLLAAAGLVMGCVSAWSLDLTEALAAAREHDAKFRSAYYDYQASREARIQGRAGLLPEISANGSAYRNHLDRSYANPNYSPTARDPANREEKTRTSQTYDSNSVALQVRQTLFNRDAWAVARRGDAQTRLGESLFAAHSDELVLRLAEAYSKVLLAQEQVRLSDAQVNALKEESAGSERLFARGEGTRTDLLESQSGLELARAQRIEADNALVDALTGLRAVVGPTVPLDNIKRLETGRYEFQALLPATLSEWQALARQNNARILSNEIAVEIAREDLARADAGHWPRVDLIGSVSRSHSDSINTLGQKNEQAAIGVQVQVPLYSGGRVTSSQRQSIAAVSKAESDLDDVVRTANLDLQTAYTTLYSGARRITALQKALESGTEQIEATRKSVAGGVRIRLDVLRAQQQATQTARDLAQARFQHALAWLKLRSLAGQLHEEDLAEVQQKLERGLLATPSAALSPS